MHLIVAWIGIALASAGIGFAICAILAAGKCADCRGELVRECAKCAEK